MPKWPGTGADDAARATFEAASAEWMQDPNNAIKLRKIVDAWKDEVYRCAGQLEALQTEARAKLHSLHSFQDTLHASQAVAAEASCEEVVLDTRHNFAKYGSKIAALVGHVQKLNLQDPFCKIICFVQWEDLKCKISAALEEFGVEHVALQGSVWARRDVLSRFQYEEIGSPRLLLLSLEESASGTNLTAANHVIIVHPMEAATKEEAVAFEMQAVGRVRRPGQQRKIFIWRFVTMGTVEQQITEEHQQELWERQQTKITVSQIAPIDDTGMDSDGFDEQEAKEAGDAADLLDLSTQRYVGTGGRGDRMPPAPAAAPQPLPPVVEEAFGTAEGSAGAAAAAEAEAEGGEDADPFLTKGFFEEDPADATQPFNFAQDSSTQRY